MKIFMNESILISLRNGKSNSKIYKKDLSYYDIYILNKINSMLRK